MKFHPGSLLVACATFALLPTTRAADTPPAAPAKGGLRYTIAVTKFENRSNYSGQFALGDSWGAVLTDSLQSTGRFIVIAESDMRTAAMSEQDFAASGRAAGGDKAPVTGNMTPAQLLVKGEITAFQDGTEGGGGGVAFGGVRLGGSSKTAEINALVYIVDSSTGQVKASKKVVGQAKSSGLSVGLTNRGFSGDVGAFKKTNVGKAVEAAIDQAVAFLIGQLESLPWTGNVILVKGNQVYFNRGEREGVTVGQVFKVGTSEVLRDPGTGEVLDNSFTEKAQIRVDTLKEKISICSIVSGTGIERGMAVAPKD
jgi:curli biogenesis system outer membrane secretion channel CsgG